ncbi:PD40 domain-containing protein [Brumimicrobium aurantiacum]|nr:PD40 domain-containing protein [Brumimicrobium aurantiacum]
MLLLLIFVGNTAFSQKTKEDLDKEAQTHFRKGEFLEATPLFLRLLSLEPRNPNYNYKYGTCLLYNANKKTEAFKYLNYSVQKNSNVDNEAYYYLGKAYHLTYNFSKAIKHYTTYKEKAGSKALAHLKVDRQIEMCRNGKTQFNDITQAIVLEKTKIDLESFFRIYDLEDIGGSLIVTEEFQSKQDRKNNHTPLIHFPANSDYIYYSSYGDDGEQKDIYFRFRNSNGEWSKESPVLGDVNTPYDEDYPYMHPNGKYLYFSSEGHNSMGGYDVFRSEFDPKSNAFKEPENMNISISSPDNDFLYIVDSLEKNAYFSSQRESELDNIHVYKVRVEKMPMEMIVLKGKFNSIVNPTHKNISIKVYDQDEDLMGLFTSDSRGEYIINLPKSGDYNFVVTLKSETKEHSETIKIPELENFRPLKLNMTEIDKEGENVVVFNSLFNEKFDNYDEIIAEAIEKQAKMNVNSNQYNLDSLNKIKEQKKIFEKIGLAQYTNVEIRDLITTKYKDLYKRQTSTDSLLSKSKLIVQNGNKDINKAIKKADSLIQLGKDDPSNSKKSKWDAMAQKEIDRSNKLKNELMDAQVILAFLEDDYKEKDQLLHQAKALNDDLKSIDTKDNVELVRVLSAHSDFVSEELLEQTNTNAYFEYLSVINEELRERDELIKRKNTLAKEKEEATNELARLNRAYENASKREKEDLSFAISKAQIKIEALDNEVNYTQQQIEEKSEIEKQKSVLAQINRSPVPENTISEHDLAEEFKKLQNELANTTEAVESQSNNESTNNNLAENNNDLSERKNTEVDSITNDNQNTVENQITEVNLQDSAKQNNELQTNEIAENNSPSSVIDEVLADYKKEIQKIEADIEAGNQTKDALIKRKYQAALKVDETKEEYISLQSENPNESSYQAKIDELDSLEKVIYREIAKIENEIAEENALATNQAAENNVDTTNIAEEVENNNSELVNNFESIEDIDENYTAEIAALENSLQEGSATKSDIVERKKEAIVKVQSLKNEAVFNAENNPENQVAQTAVQQLTEIENSLSEEITVLETEIQAETEALATNQAAENNVDTTNIAEEVENTNTELVNNFESIEDIDEDYAAEIAALENSLQEGSATKSDIVERKKEAMAKVQSLKNEAVLNAENNPENQAAQTTVQQLTEIENTLSEEITVLETEIQAESEALATNQAAENTVDTTKIAEEVENTNTELVNNFESIEDIDENYAAEIAALENSLQEGSATKSDIVERKKEAIVKVQSLKNEAVFNAENNPENQVAQTAVQQLTEIENSLSEEITVLETEIQAETEALATNQAAENNVDTTNIAEEVENTNNELVNNFESIEDIDENYTAEIAALENGLQEGSATKSDIVERKKEAMAKVQSLKNEAVLNAENAPEKQAAQTAVQQLTEIENTLSEEITVLETEIQAETEALATNQAAENTVDTTNIAEEVENTNSEIVNNFESIEDIDENYTAEIAALENSLQEGSATKSDIVERKKEAIAKVQSLKNEAILNAENNPENQAAQTAVQQLTEIENTLSEEITVLETEIQAETEALATNQAAENNVDTTNIAEEVENTNTELVNNFESIEDIDENYTAEIAALENSLQEGSATKSDIVERKKEAIAKVQSLKNEAVLNAENNPENQATQTAVQQLTEIENTLSEEITVLETEIQAETEALATNQAAENTVDTTNIAEEISSETLLKTLDPSYLDDITEIEEAIKNGDASTQELIKRKYQALIVVGDAKTEAILENEQTPSSTLMSKVNTLTEIEDNINTEIDELESKVELVSAQKEAEPSIAENKIGLDITRASIPDKVNKSQTKKEKEKINDLFNEKDELISQAEIDPSLKDDVKFQRKIEKIDDKIATEINKGYENSILKKYPNLTKKSNNIVNRDTKNINSLNSHQSMMKVDDLIQDLESINDPKKKLRVLQEIYQETEKVEGIITQIRRKQNVDAFIEDIIEEQRISNVNTTNATQTRASLEKEQSQISDQLTELKDQLASLKAKQAVAKSNQIELIEYNISQLQQLKMDLDNKYYDNNILLSQMKQQQIDDANKGISREAKKNTLTYAEEVKIASSEEYINQLRNNNRLNQAQHELRVKEEDLKIQHDELKAIYENVENGLSLTRQEKEEIATKLNTISKTKEEVKVLRENVRAKQEAVAETLPLDEDLRRKTENMIARDVAPIKNLPIKSAVMKTAKVGLVINENQNEENLENREVKIINKVEDHLGGLIFRVQIGAFKKPVPNSTFSQFSPISGDKIGSGWIKYVVGLFGNKNTAEIARDKIRTMGYSDAFIVAYCDGERIPVYRAMQLLESGACTPLVNKDEDLIAEETITNKAQTENEEIDELAYNRSAGSAKADVVENKSGLFYTVQVGVYNTPATSEQLMNISPLITKRLPNGVLRYSSGVFNSYSEALPKKEEAVKKGITDAYIVAYYNGVRIPASKANEILASEGESVLQSNKVDDTAEESTYTTTEEVKQAPFINEANTQSLLVSKNKYSSFPTQELNRYNEYNELFYYNPKSKHIQSFLFENDQINTEFSDEFDIKKVYNYTYNVVDTETPFRNKALENAGSSMIQLKVVIDINDLNADLMYAILNATPNKMMNTSSQKVTVEFFAIDHPSNAKSIDELQALLKKLGATKINKMIKIN